MSKSTRVPGHGLRHEGMAFVGEGICEVGGRLRRNEYDRLGVALCECGWRSEVLESNAQRKDAHREHKVEVKYA